MRKIATVALTIAIVVVVLAAICHLRHSGIAGLSGKYYLAIANTALLFAITVLLMEKK